MRGRGLGRGSLERVRAAGGKWAYQGRWKDASGRRRRRNLSTDRREAERMLARIIRERDLELAGLGSENQDIQLEVLKERFIADLTTRCTSGYVERAKGCLESILEDVPARLVSGLRPEHVLEFRRKRLEGGVTNRTANMHVSILKTMLNWGARNGLIAQNPIAAVGNLPQGKAQQKIERRALTDVEIAALLTASRELDREGEARSLAEASISGGTKGRPFETRDRKPRVPQTPLWMTLLETGAGSARRSRRPGATSTRMVRR